MSMRRARTGPIQAVHRAFTLLEMMVVIAIIVMLVGLMVAVATSLHSQSDVRSTQNTLRLLDMALHDWEVAADRQLSWGKNDAPPGALYDVQGNQTGDIQAFDAVGLLAAVPSSNQVLSRIDPAQLQRGKRDPLNQTSPVGPFAVDAWGNRIILLHPGRLWKTGDLVTDRDADGTIRTRTTMAEVNASASEDKLGICVNRRPIFISAGPDGALGDLQLNVNPTSRNAARVAQASNNLYSEPPLKESPEFQ